MAVLDTTILVDLLRKRQGPAARRAAAVLRALVADGEVLMTTRFNTAGLYVGTELSSDPDGEAARVDAALAPLRILDFDDAAARAYGRIEASLRSSGRPVGDMDALIASVALSNGQSVVTRNARHFQPIPGLVVHAVE